MIRKEHKPTLAQKMYGKTFGNTAILCERTDSMRSVTPSEDKILFREYKHALRVQAKNIKRVLR